MIFFNFWIKQGLEAKMKGQEKIKKIRVEGVSGSNSVKVILDGEEMQKIEISNEILNEDKWLSRI